MSRRLLMTCLLILAPPVAAHAATLWVATNGVDTSAAPECGKLTSPCRSFGKVLSLAQDGDMIIVFPGRYGAPQEPPPAPGCIAPCMINVNKRVTITSRDGARATVLDAGGADVNVVRITHDGVVFGKKNKGFSLVNGTVGLGVANGLTGVMVTGNQAGGNADTGFVIAGDGAVVTGNRSGANGNKGFSVFGTGHKFVGNLAAVNTGTAGFTISGSGHQLTGNLAIDNAQGFRVEVGAGTVHLGGNAVLGNNGAGVVMAVGSGGVSVNKGSIFGNDSTGGNCGLLNQSAGAVDATGNFWGAMGGPGIVEPADKACDTGGGTTTTTPFATREIKVRAP